MEVVVGECLAGVTGAGVVGVGLHGLAGAIRAKDAMEWWVVCQTCFWASVWQKQ